MCRRCPAPAPPAFRQSGPRPDSPSLKSVDRDALRLEHVERPARVEQLAFDHRMPLKRGQRIVEALDRQAGGIPIRRGPQFVLAILAREREFAHDRFAAVATEGPAEDADVSKIAATPIDRGPKCGALREGGHVHGWADRKCNVTALRHRTSALYSGTDSGTYSGTRRDQARVTLRRGWRRRSRGRLWRGRSSE